MATEVTLDGKTFRTDDLTLDEVCQIESVTGTTWLSMNPVRSATVCRAVMVAFLSRDRDATEAAKFVGALTADEAAKALRVADDDLPTEFEGGVPLAAADSATTGS